MRDVYTIGHSTHSWETFFGLIKPYGIEVIVDVRSTPYSKMAQDFNRENLIELLVGEGIKYLFMGDQLGGRSNDPDCISEGRVDYDSLSRSADFQEGFTRLLKGSKDYTIALMCSEKEPLICHRTILISRYLIDASITVKHILGDGTLEEHNKSVERLLQEEGISEDLLRSLDEVVLDAYKAREKKIAYKIGN